MLNLSNVQAQSDILPAGQYMAVVTGAEIKKTNSGTGEYIQVELTISSQAHTGRKVWDNFNIKNDNQKAVDIGLSKLKAMALAIGFTETEMTNFKPEMLANKEVGIKTKIKADPTWGDKAEVASYVKASALPAHAAVSKDSIPF